MQTIKMRATRSICVKPAKEDATPCLPPRSFMAKPERRVAEDVRHSKSIFSVLCIPRKATFMVMPVLTVPATHNSVAPSRILLAKLEALRKKLLLVAVLTGLAIALAVGVEMLALAMFLDWWLDLPRSVRAVMLLAQAGIA